MTMLHRLQQQQHNNQPPEEALNMLIKKGSVAWTLWELVLWIEQKKKNSLPKMLLRQQTKTADDDDNNAVTHIKKTHNNQPNCGVCLSNNVDWSHH